MTIHELIGVACFCVIVTVSVVSIIAAMILIIQKIKDRIDGKTRN